ncbi:unnamed protein product, partial [Effrenium voratum]
GMTCSSKQAYQLADLRLVDITLLQLSAQAKARLEGLHAEVAAVREELREADVEIQMAASESATANAELRDSRHRHQQWLRSMQDEATRLRREGQRLERSYHQAGLEERRIAELARAQPAMFQEKLATLKASCERLEIENERLERDLHEGQSDLSSVQEVVAHAASQRTLRRETSTRSASSLGRRTPPQGRSLRTDGMRLL